MGSKELACCLKLKTNPMALSCQKHLFSLDAQVHYLNGAYMSPMLQSVEAAGRRGLLGKRSPNRIAPADFFTDPERLRGLFAQLIQFEG